MKIIDFKLSRGKVLLCSATNYSFHRVDIYLHCSNYDEFPEGVINAPELCIPSRYLSLFSSEGLESCVSSLRSQRPEFGAALERLKNLVADGRCVGIFDTSTQRAKNHLDVLKAILILEGVRVKDTRIQH